MSEEIEQELKLSKKQNKNDRYNYLCSQFNGIEYAIKLEKYTNKLLKENTQVKKQLKETNNCLNLQIANVTLLEKELKDKDEKISKAIEIIRNDTTLNPQRQRDRLTNILESNKED